MEQVQKRKKWPIVIGIIAVVIVVAIIAVQVSASAASQPVYEIYTVEAGDITKSVTASGTLQAQDDIEVDLPAAIELEETMVHVGDSVTEGQTLAALDIDSLNRYYKGLVAQLNTVDRELMTVEKETKTIKAPIQGRIKQILIEKGDNLGDYEYIMLLSTDGKMKVEVSTEKDIDLTEELKVKYGDGHEKTGSILAKTGDGYTVTVPDDGPKLDGTAEIYFDDELIGTGTFKINAPIKVIADGGIVKDITVEENDSVSAGSTLVTLENKVTTDSYQEKFDERQDIEDKMTEARGYLQNPVIVSPVAGIVRTIDEAPTSQQGGSDSMMGGAALNMSALQQTQQAGAAQGTAVSADTTSSEERTVFELSAGGVTELPIEIDEMDIAAIEPGQKAVIAIDALGAEQFAAKVDRISRIGNSANGVTTYDVILVLEKDDERFFEGMNASVTIVAEQIEDTVLIPLELVQEDKDGTFVEISPSGNSNGADRRRVEVTEGVSDGINVQIQSGLNAGDKIVYLNESAGSTVVDFIQNGGLFSSAS